jgi:hypothetical protein
VVGAACHATWTVIACTCAHMAHRLHGCPPCAICRCREPSGSLNDGSMVSLMSTSGTQLNAIATHSAAASSPHGNDVQTALSPAGSAGKQHDAECHPRGDVQSVGALCTGSRPHNRRAMHAPGCLQVNCRTRQRDRSGPASGWGMLARQRSGSRRRRRSPQRSRPGRRYHCSTSASRPSPTSRPPCHGPPRLLRQSTPAAPPCRRPQRPPRLQWRPSQRWARPQRGCASRHPSWTAVRPRRLQLSHARHSRQGRQLTCHWQIRSWIGHNQTPLLSQLMQRRRWRVPDRQLTGR